MTDTPEPFNIADFAWGWDDAHPAPVPGGIVSIEPGGDGRVYNVTRDPAGKIVRVQTFGTAPEAPP
jgi:hypothetical protein